MTGMKLNDMAAWKTLTHHADIMNRPEKHLKYLIKEKDRLLSFSLNGAGIFYDFSRQRIDERTMELLFKLSDARKLKEKFTAMVSGEKINTTENRAALHTAARNFSGNPVFVDGKNIMPDINKGK
jgi:glucose-6-phosphate isomerase